MFCFLRWSLSVMCSYATPVPEQFFVSCQSTPYKTGWLSLTCGYLHLKKLITVSTAAVTLLEVIIATVVVITLAAPMNSNNPLLLTHQVTLLWILTVLQKSGLETLPFMSSTIHISPWQDVQRYVCFFIQICKHFPDSDVFAYVMTMIFP